MTRRVRMAALMAGLAVAVPAGASVGGASPGPPGRWCVVATDRDTGAVVGRLPLDTTNRFALTYRHSYFGEPATEWLRVDPAGGIVVERIESPSLAVLDYYELTGATAGHTHAGWAIDVPTSEPLTELTVVASPLGRRTLMSGSSKLPLWHLDGRARAIAVTAPPRGDAQCGEWPA